MSRPTEAHAEHCDESVKRPADAGITVAVVSMDSDGEPSEIGYRPT